MNRQRLFLLTLGLSLLLIVSVYRHWFTPGIVFGGDHFFPPFTDMPAGLPHRPFAWDMQKGNGLGGVSYVTLWIDTYAQLVPNLLQSVGLPGQVTQKLVFTWAFLLLGGGSIVYLMRTLFPRIGPAGFLAPVYYLTNSYILMVMSGGQFGIGMAYAVTPLVLAAAVRVVEGVSWRRVGWLGGLLALQIFFDLRYAYITMGLLCAFILLRLTTVRASRLRMLGRDLLRLLLVPAGIAGIIHGFWIVPLLVFRVNPAVQLGEAYTGTAAVRFFSFADFSHAFAWLQPNWPENIFGKTFFLQPEFLILPLLAFAACWLSRQRHLSLPVTERTTVLALSGMALAGAFLAKGTQEPFGAVYLYLFEHLPGFVLFRDPTKFFVLISLSYALLIPLTVRYGSSAVQYWLERHTGRRSAAAIEAGLFLLAAAGWIVIMRQAYTSTLPGTFRPVAVHQEYIRLKDFLLAQPGSWRTLWVPRHDRLAFFDMRHPLMDAEHVPLPEGSDWFGYIGTPQAKALLQAWNVRYIIVPHDSFGDIFVTDRTYDGTLRQQTVDRMAAVPWLQRVSGFSDIAVFSLSDTAGAAVGSDGQGNDTAIPLELRSPVSYRMLLPAGLKSLTVSLAYHPGWELQAAGRTVTAEPGAAGTLAFTPDGIQGEALLQFRPQRLVDRMGLVSAVFLLFLCGWILSGRHDRNRKQVS